MYWQNKRILVLGYGITGKSMISYLRRKRAIVYIYDDKLGFSYPDSSIWENKDAVFQLTEADIDMLAVSPGFAPTHPVVSHFVNKSIPTIGDIEIAYIDRGKNDWIAITGTNGKTTTTMLIDHLLRKLGENSQTFGNIGVPVLDAVEFEGIPVVEVSSFQLEYAPTFKPHIGVFLNLTPDHLNRHGDMQGYFLAKMRMFLNQNSDDFAIFNDDDEWANKGKTMVSSSVVMFSPSGKDADIVAREQKIYVRDNLLWDLTGNTRFLYPPYLEDLLGALGALIALGYEDKLREITSDVLDDFVFARHRMEEVATIGGVIFINDSKATNVASTIAAIKGFEGSKLLLILGGSRKDTSYDKLAEEIKRLGVKYVTLIGDTAPDIKNSLDKVGYKNYEHVATLEDAVRLLWSKSQPGDIILLSPACASFDMFNNYKHRGDTFVEIVNRLAKEYD